MLRIMQLNGTHFTATLDALELDAVQRAETEENASGILAAIVRAYGTDKAGSINSRRAPNQPVTGLVYGRIQSGKTRAMIATTALAFDNDFRISIVLTSNINDLVSQTHFDFTRGLPGAVIFTKDNDLEREVARTRIHLERGGGRLLLVCSKGSQSLTNISTFLEQLGADRYPSIIFDDEGDQASLDTNIRRRSRLRIAVAPSPINAIIQDRLRPAVIRHVYVSVTGTPQAVLLQSADSNNRPSFIQMLPPGASYVGGDTFFAADEPEDNSSLVSLVDQNEQQQLLARNQPIPVGLRSSILFFLVSAASAISTGRLPERGYSYLCHPSLRNNEQAIAEQKINAFLTSIYEALVEQDDDNIIRDLRAAHTSLAQTLGAQCPPFDRVRTIVQQYIPSLRLLVINASVKRRGIDYGPGLNLLIGGNTLGRGIAIRDLLVTYYVRETRVSQIDTMHQHARMYGYRSDTLPYTRLFIPRHLYYRFRDIHRSDQDSREFIQAHIEELPKTFPIEVAFNLRATRQGVLEAGKVDTLHSGMHIYPNHVSLPQSDRAYGRVLKRLREALGTAADATIPQLEQAAKGGVVIDVAVAQALIDPIKTGSKNTWRDSTIETVIEKVAGKFDDQVVLRFRSATRTVQREGFISTGTLSGDELRAARASPIPTLWLMAARTAPGSPVGQDLDFVYPTFVIPSAFPSLYIFNRGA